MKAPAVIEKMTARQGKILRYVVSTSDQPVSPLRCVVKIKWSDLPHSDMQARKEFSILRRYGLVKRIDKDAFEPTDQGRAVIAYADKEGLWRQAPPPKKEGLWRQAPPPKKTNKFFNRKDK